MSRLAYMTPLPPVRSGVAQNAATVLAELGGLPGLDVDVFTDQARVEAPALESVVRSVADARRFPSAASDYDGVVYEMGNSWAHALIFEMLRIYPGILRLHDPVVHHFYVHYYVKQGRIREYARALRRSEGRQGARLARVVAAHKGGGLSYFDLPMFREVVEASVGVVVHNRWSARQIRRAFPATPILCRTLPVAPPPPPTESVAESRRRWGLPEGAFAVGAFGFQTPAKRIDRLVEGVARARAQGRDARLLIAGEVSPLARIEERIAAAGLEDSAVVTGYLSDDDYWSAMRAVDAVAILRFPTAGESSLQVLEALSLGKVVIVSALRQFLEIPVSAVLRVPIGRGEAAALGEVLSRVSEDSDLVHSLGEAGQAYVATRATPEGFARGLAAFAKALAPISRARLAAGVERVEDARRRAADRVERAAWRGLDVDLEAAERRLVSGAACLTEAPAPS